MTEQPRLSPCRCGGTAAYTNTKVPNVSCVRCGKSIDVETNFVIKPESSHRDHQMWKAVFAWNEGVER